jgi:hypothetical protein
MLKLKATAIFFAVFAFIGNAYSCKLISSCTYNDSTECITISGSAVYDECNKTGCGEGVNINNFYFTVKCGTLVYANKWCDGTTMQTIDTTPFGGGSTAVGLCRQDVPV